MAAQRCPTVADGFRRSEEMHANRARASLPACSQASVKLSISGCGEREFSFERYAAYLNDASSYFRDSVMDFLTAIIFFHVVALLMPE